MILSGPTKFPTLTPGEDKDVIVAISQITMDEKSGLQQDEFSIF